MLSVKTRRVSVCAIACTAILSACSDVDETNPEYQQITIARATQLCLEFDDKTAAALAARKRRLVLSLNQYSATDKVTFIHVKPAGKGEPFRTPLMHRKGFKAKSSKHALRFFLPFFKPASNDRRACYNIRLSGDSSASANVKLEVSQELPGR